MESALLFAVLASIGNLLQGWDNATIAGAILYIKEEFQLESEPMIEGLIVAMSLIGATIITTFSGVLADSIGRRPLLIASSVLYFVSGLFMMWSPSMQILLLARLIDGFGIGLAVTIVPVYISETAPSESRGRLSTLPQFCGSGGMFLAYCMVFAMSLIPKPEWRIMLGVLSAPALLCFVLTAFYLPESPRWLVSKGRMTEAKHVLQKLRRKDNVDGELALLVEGLGVGRDTSIEEYVIVPDDQIAGELFSADQEKITLLGAQEGQSWIARPVKGQDHGGSNDWMFASRPSGDITRSAPLIDPVVSLLDSVHEKTPSVMGSLRSGLFPNFGSLFSLPEQQQRNDGLDENDGCPDDDDGVDNADESLLSPLLVHEISGSEEIASHSSAVNIPRINTLMPGRSEVKDGSMDAAGEWHLAWRWSGKEGEEGLKEGSFKRIYLYHGSAPGRSGSVASAEAGEMVEQCVLAAALVSTPTLFPKQLTEEHPVGPAMLHPSSIVTKGPRWRDVLEPGVKHALIVGVGLQILQQFAGINGVLYYTPRIMEQAGVDVILANIGIGAASASILSSAVTTLLMLPSIGIAMKLMDSSGRRFLLLATIPMLIASLAVLVLVNLVSLGAVPHAVLSMISVITYFCCFVMGFGPIPNIICTEIFPTPVRGVCIAICALAFWIGDIVVTYTLPVMLDSVGLAGAFGMYAAVCAVAYVFVFAKVPETKGVPLEVISEFFAIAAAADGPKRRPAEPKRGVEEVRVDIDQQ